MNEDDLCNYSFWNALSDSILRPLFPPTKKLLKSTNAMSSTPPIVANNTKKQPTWYFILNHRYSILVFEMLHQKCVFSVNDKEKIKPFGLEANEISGTKLIFSPYKPLRNHFSTSRTFISRLERSFLLSTKEYTSWKRH